EQSRPVQALQAELHREHQNESNQRRPKSAQQAPDHKQDEPKEAKGMPARKDIPNAILRHHEISNDRRRDVEAVETSQAHLIAARSDVGRKKQKHLLDGRGVKKHRFSTPRISPAEKKRGKVGRGAALRNPMRSYRKIPETPSEKKNIALPAIN